MEKRNLTCIVCPMGCALEVTLEGGKVLSVTGNTCPRGEQYTRVLTTTVRVEGGERPVVPVKTAAPIPKERLFDAMEEARSLSVRAPVRIGEIIKEDLCGTGIPLKAAADIGKGRNI